MRRPASVSLMYELSSQCNQRCLFCYNSWRRPDEAPKRELPTARVKDLLARAIDGSACRAISLSGGEPLERRDLFEIISFVKKRGVRVSLVTNGTLLVPETIDRALESGVDLFQVSLLSADRELHNRLVGMDGYDRAIEAIIGVRDRGGEVCTFFVGLADNLPTFRKTLELNVLLGVKRVALGRFTPGGAGLPGWERLMPSPDAMNEALAAADELSGKYRLTVSVATPVMPCLNNLAEYPRVRFSFCSIGNAEDTLFGIDPEGNLKACSHSPVVLGSLLTESFETLSRDPFLEKLAGTLPAFCLDCPDAPVCRGGCRSSAQVVRDSFDAEDPYLSLFKSKAIKPSSPTFVSGTEASA
jgi:radical SAM protein with 4Fe4S-binding SPASM domain